MQVSHSFPDFVFNIRELLRYAEEGQQARRWLARLAYDYQDIEIGMARLEDRLAELEAIELRYRELTNG